MDTVSHAAWGFATLHSRNDLRWWGALAGALPDLLWFIPSTVERMLARGWAGAAMGSDRTIWRADGPPLPPELVESYFRYYVYSHSLVLLAVATLLLMARTRWRTYAWLAIPYALHIVMDIPTHERYQTQPFYPLSSWRFDGLTWTDPRIFWPNLCALVAVYAWIITRRRPAGSGRER
jgi:LexA-binding, inner membrane-associated putative hydrolase